MDSRALGGAVYLGHETMTLKQVLFGVAMSCVPITTIAETVTLRADATRLEISGDLQSYDGTIWVVKTPMGEIRLPAAGITCIRGACPSEEDLTEVANTPAAPAAPGVDTLPNSNEVSSGTAISVASAPTELAAPALGNDQSASEPEVPSLGDAAQIFTPEIPTLDTTGSVAEPQLSAPVISSTRSFDESRIRMAGQSVLMRNLAPLMVETWGFLDQRDFSQTGSADARVLLLSGGGLDPLDVELIGATQGDIAELMDQSFIDIALAGEEILKDLPDADYSVIGLDAAAFITTRDNQLNALSINNLPGILSGEITNWNELGGPDMPIRLMLPGDENSTAFIIAEQILAEAGLQVSPNAQRVESEALLADSVARERGAIGIVGFAEVRNARPLAIADTCGLRTAPDEFAIKAGDYPLIRRILALYPAGGTSESTASLLEFMTGTMAERTLVNAGYVALAPATANVSEQGLRFAQVTLDPSTRGSGTQLIDFTQTLIDARRLSLTLRAGAQENGLDSRGNDDMSRLAALISANRYSGQEILLVGFTDSARTAGDSLALSLERATEAANALIAEIGTMPAGVAVTPVGYGHVAPLACNADPRGAIVNNRIEVWARVLR